MSETRKPQINKARTERMKRRSTQELIAYAKSGSLSAAAAIYELEQHRGVKDWGR